MRTEREHQPKRSTARARVSVDEEARSIRSEGECLGGENTVVLVGRVSAAPEMRELPSGDVLVTFRIVVPRAGRRRETNGKNRTVTERTTVDVIDVACWTARTRRSALRLDAGGRARVEGSLRRSFFRAGGTTVSRYEVEAASVRPAGTSR